MRVTPGTRSRPRARHSAHIRRAFQQCAAVCGRSSDRSCQQALRAQFAIDQRIAFRPARFFAKHNNMPTMWQAGVYSSVVHYLKAVEMAGAEEAVKGGERMGGVTVEKIFFCNREVGGDGRIVYELVLV